MPRHASRGSDHELLSGKLQTEPPPICRSLTIVLLSNVRADALSRNKVDLAAMVFGEKYETPAERATTRPAPKMVVTVTGEDGALFLQGTGGEFEPPKHSLTRPSFSGRCMCWSSSRGTVAAPSTACSGAAFTSVKRSTDPRCAVHENRADGVE